MPPTHSCCPTLLSHLYSHSLHPRPAVCLSRYIDICFPQLLQSDVDEALRLMRMSKISLSDEAGGRGGVDAISAIYSRVRDDAIACRKATYTWAELTSLSGQDFSVRTIKILCTKLRYQSDVLF